MEGLDMEGSRQSQHTGARRGGEAFTISEQDGAAKLNPSASDLAPEDMEGILVEDIGR